MGRKVIRFASFARDHFVIPTASAECPHCAANPEIQTAGFQEPGRTLSASNVRRVYFLPQLYFFWNFSTRPALSTNFMLPV